MKKLFTVAALASVAFTADFLGQHRPAALVKDGLNIVKDVKSHSYGKLIKDGVKITKELKLEDQELFSPGIPTDPKEELKLVRQSLELMEMMLGGDDNEFFAANQQDQLREMRDLLLSNESTLRELNALLPLIKEESPQLYPKCLEEYNKQKENIAQLRKKVEEFEAAAEAKTQTPVKSQPMRRLFAEDNELFYVNEREDQLRQVREQIPHVEAIIKEFEEVNLPVIKIFFPDQYEIALEKLNSQKAQIAEAKLALEEAENQLKAQSKSTQGATKFRKLQPDDDELFNLGELLKEGKKVRDEIKHH